MVDSRWFGYGGGGSYHAADPDGEAAYRDFRFMGVASPARAATAAGSDRACSAVEGGPDVLPILIRERAEGWRLSVADSGPTQGQLCHGAQLVTGAHRGAEPGPVAIMNLMVMQPAGAVSYIDEGDRR